MLIACSGDGGGDRWAIGLKLEGASPSLVWENKKDLPYVPTGLTHGDHFYFVNDGGVAGCFEIKTGKKVWFERIATGKSVMTASPVLIDGKVYAPTEDGDVIVFNAAPKFELLSRNNMGEMIRATPAVADNRLYIRGANHLFCIGKKE